MYYLIRWTGRTGKLNEYFCSYECAQSSTENVNLIEEIDTPIVKGKHHAHCCCGRLLWKGRRFNDK